MFCEVSVTITMNLQEINKIFTDNATIYAIFFLNVIHVFLSPKSKLIKKISYINSMYIL